MRSCGDLDGAVDIRPQFVAGDSTAACLLDQKDSLSRDAAPRPLGDRLRSDLLAGGKASVDANKQLSLRTAGGAHTLKGGGCVHAS